MQAVEPVIVSNGMSPNKFSIKSIPSSLFRYYIVGIVATLMHVIIVAVLIEKFDFKAGPANGIAFFLATIFSYIMNTYWSFQAKMSFFVLCKFWSVALIGCLFAIFISSAAESLSLHYLLGIAMVMSVVPVISYFLHRNWTYK